MYEIKDLSEVEFSIITICMREAFSDYYVKMELSDEALYHRFKSENVRYDLSCGAFFEGELSGRLTKCSGRLTKCSGRIQWGKGCLRCCNRCCASSSSQRTVFKNDGLLPGIIETV